MPANRSVGEVEFTIGAETYIARFGNRELARLEEAFGVKGVGQIYREGVDTSVTRFIQFAKVALERHQPELTADQVSDLLDYRDENGIKTANKAIVEAYMAIVPKERTPETTTKARTKPLPA